MAWEKELEELAARRARALEMGGPERVERQRQAGKLTVRERISAVLDSGSFDEVGRLTGRGRYEDGELRDFTPANFVFGLGQIDGRRVVVAGDDFTVRGGSAEASNFQKQVASEQLARDLRIPIVRLVDGSGGGGSVKGFGDDVPYNRVPAMPTWPDITDALGEIPVLAAALGSVAGLGAAKVVAAHFSVMVRETSHVFVAGPPLVPYATGQTVTKEELGGSQIHTRNGVVDNEVASEAEAFDLLRRVLSYLPANVHELPARGAVTDDPLRREEALASLIPKERRRAYKVRPLIEHVVDRGSFLEKAPLFGRSLVTGFARADGWPIGVVANDAMQTGGAMTADAARKLESFVDLCDTFHLPIVNFTDQPGFAVGPRFEEAATIRFGVRALMALEQSSVPLLTFLVRRAYGVAGATNRRARRFSLRYAWPSGEWGSLPLEGGIEAAYRRDLEAAADPAKLREEIMRGLLQKASPFRSAEAFDVEDVIDPRETRPILCRWAGAAYASQCATLGPKRRGMRP